LREALRTSDLGGMCHHCLAEAAKGEEHDEKCPVGIAVRKADEASGSTRIILTGPALHASAVFFATMGGLPLF
jgi:hypothetical protein